MVKKRVTSRRARVTNVTLRDLVNNNHLETIERLTKLETALADSPKRIEKLEAWRNYLAGAWATTIGAIGLYFKFKGH